MNPWDLDGQVDSTALCRLEGNGLPVLTVLRQFYDAAPPGSQEVLMTLKEQDKIISMWMSGAPGQNSTWRSLFTLLGELEQPKLRRQIEQYLTG